MVSPWHYKFLNNNFKRYVMTVTDTIRPMTSVRLWPHASPGSTRHRFPWSWQFHIFRWGIGWSHVSSKRPASLLQGPSQLFYYGLLSSVKLTPLRVHHTLACLSTCFPPSCAPASMVPDAQSVFFWWMFNSFIQVKRISAESWGGGRISFQCRFFCCRSLFITCLRIV